MKKFLALGLVFLLLFAVAFAEEPELNETQNLLLQYANKQQLRYIELMNSEEVAYLWDTIEESEDTRALFEQICDSSPKAAILLSTKTELSLENQDVTEGVPAAMMPNICFNRMYYTIANEGEWSLARLSVETALLDTANIPEIPAISYVIFLYGIDLPEIVTVFVRTPSDGIVTYTSFVHIPSERKINGEGFFASEVVSRWKADIFDSVILNPLPSLVQ